MEKLIEKAKKGDKESFTKLMLLVEKELYHVAKARLKSDDDIYDAIQETAIIAYKNIRKLKENTVKTKRTRAIQKIKDILEKRRNNNGWHREKIVSWLRRRKRDTK